MKKTTVRTQRQAQSQRMARYSNSALSTKAKQRSWKLANKSLKSYSKSMLLLSRTRIKKKALGMLALRLSLGQSNIDLSTRMKMVRLFSLDLLTQRIVKSLKLKLTTKSAFKLILVLKI